MAEYIKNVNLQELKDKYIDNHGFVLLTNTPVGLQGIENLSNTIINKGITKDFPLLVTQIQNATIFVYEDFDAPFFFSHVDQFNIIGVGEVMPLLFFLKQNS